MEKTDAGLGGLYIREITVYHTTVSIHKTATVQHYGSRCHVDLLCSRTRTVLPDLIKTYSDDVSSFCRNDIIRQTVPRRNNAVSKVIFPEDVRPLLKYS